MRFFNELKRRNVLRMAVLYLVTAWVVVQVADALIGLASLPAWSGQVVLGLLAIGFPIALIFSWFFEVTPEGVSLEKDVPAGQPVTHAAGRRMDFVIIAILAAGLILFAWDKWWPGGPLELSIAVLPFENVSADPEQEYFSDGISDEVRNLVAQIKPLKVIARQSSFYFKGKDADITTIAQQLNVRHVLEGSVRRNGDRVRITAQLIDAEDSSLLWSQPFDRDYDAENLFYIQAEIARTIADRLRVTLTGEDEARLARVPTKNTEAYAAYLLGRDRLRDRKVDDLKDAVEQFAKAMELDPKLAGAYSGFADACHLYEIYSRGRDNEHCPISDAELEQLARKAVELDPELGEAWISLGNLLSEQVESETELREAIAAFERGLDLNPNHSQGYHWYGMALRSWQLYGDHSRWIDAWKAGVWESVFDKGLEVDPLSIPLHYIKAYYPLHTKSKEEALWHGRRMVEIAPDSPRGYEMLGEQAWFLQGRLDESIRWESLARERDPHHVAFATSMGRAYSELGDPVMALAYFDLAKALVAPDSQSFQNRLLTEQAMIRFLSDPEDEQKATDLQVLLDEPSAMASWMKIEFGVYLDLTLGQPADALARIEKLRPECIGAKDIPDDCPAHLIVRVYQALGDDAAARDLVDTIRTEVQKWETWSEAYPENDWRLVYAGALATTGHADQALDVLDDLVSSGWRGHFRFYYLRFMFCCWVDFDAIREHEQFQAIVATIETDLARQLENVRAMQRRGEVSTLEEVNALVASRRESG